LAVHLAAPTAALLDEKLAALWAAPRAAELAGQWDDLWAALWAAG